MNGDFSTHTRAPGDDVIVPGPWVILEGLFAIYWPELRELLDVKLFVEAANEVCLDRRIERDVRERGRTRESIIEQYARTVCAGAFQCIYPTKFHADLVLSGVDSLEHSGTKVLNYIQHAQRGGTFSSEALRGRNWRGRASLRSGTGSDVKDVGRRGTLGTGLTAERCCRGIRRAWAGECAKSRLAAGGVAG